MYIRTNIPAGLLDQVNGHSDGLQRFGGNESAKSLAAGSETIALHHVHRSSNRSVTIEVLGHAKQCA